MTKDTDRELLEKAAKAAGIDLDWDVPPKSPPWRMSGVGEDKGPAAQWNPITDDGDALRLATYITAFGWQFSTLDAVAIESLQKSEDVTAATRLAIVRAAAAIGEAMP